ncbi:MAG TPA: hypothetical protein VFB68_09010 [Xanthobacteraceae bacterium]|nr:hypothetical protein [Xanthobacteraceae bacterium]
MIGIFDYRERISECAQWAETAANDQAKVLWKEMEQFWRQREICIALRSDAASGFPVTDSSPES